MKKKTFTNKKAVLLALALGTTLVMGGCSNKELVDKAPTENVEAVKEARAFKNFVVINEDMKATAYDENAKVIDELELSEKPTNYNIKQINLKDSVLLFNQDSNELIEVALKGKKIDSKRLLEDLDLSNLKDMFLTKDGELLLVFNESNTIKKIDLGSESIEDISLVGNVDSISIDGDNIIYTSVDKLVKYNVPSEASKEILLGDKSTDLIVDKGFAYVVNQFGEGKNNSTFFKVNIKDMKIEDIMELKGVKSKVLNQEDNTLYMYQPESKHQVKSIDMEKFKPSKAFSLLAEDSKTELTNVKSFGKDILFVEDNKTKIFDTNKKETKELSKEVEGKYIVLVK